ncbi:IS66 family transposase [Achromobacter xylosoxidans]|uniref:IS66 family transposase n=1 Tax=Alcaligenes xylosoxydans xylosoxydans TaxID=85698 RepID=UPI000B48D6CE|nr:IS66 family transposase [Achromobacter xylosoxidans]
MVDLTQLRAEDLEDLPSEALTQLAARLLAQVNAQAGELRQHEQRAERYEREIKFKDAKLERITFELARHKAWKFGAKTERMNAMQRQMFEDTGAEDEADLQAQLDAIRAAQGKAPSADTQKRAPRREKLAEHLRRIEHRHEPADTTCGCGQPMQRMGEDVSERLDIIPAEFIVHRHVRGKWVCRCCQTLVQEPVAPHVVDKGQPTAGLVAHTLVSRFVDHVPYYRQEQINARSGVHTPRSTLAGWAGAGGAALAPLYEALREFVLKAKVLHADETPVAMLDPGAGKTRKAYVWAYARGAFDALPAVVYDFAPGRAARHPIDFLGRWSGTLTCDDYAGYGSVFKLHGRVEAGCLAHARRKFDELAKSGASPIAAQALQRFAWLYRIEQEVSGASSAQRLAARRERSAPLWEQLHLWLRQERGKVPDGGGIAAAIDYSLRRWQALGRFLHDGDVAIDNNHIENLMRPWAMGRKAWLFAGSELAGQRAAMVMSLVQSARLSGHEPWAYLKDVLERLLEYPNHRIDELLPHRWTPNVA